MSDQIIAQDEGETGPRKFRVYFQTFTDVTVEVEAADYEAAIEEAYEHLPSGVCAQCSGWGREWSRDEGEPEPYEVTDAATDESLWRELGEWRRVIDDPDPKQAKS